MRFLPDHALYSSVDGCLGFLRTLPEETPSSVGTTAPVPVHFFWQGRFSAKQALCLKSFFATQDLSRFSCWLWLGNSDSVTGAAANPHLAPLLPFLKLRLFDPAETFDGTPFANQAWLGKTHRAIPLSDFARLAILHHHGGIYSDLDVIFLRDLGPLLRLVGDAELCFQWSYLARGANGFLRLHRGGQIVRDLMESAYRNRSGHSSGMLDYGRDTVGLLILPSAFFSPLWLHADGKNRSTHAPFHRFADFFRPFRWWFRPVTRVSSHRELFPGAFTYHWHGCWQAPETRTSCAGLVAASLEAKLHLRLPALDRLPPYGATH